MFLYNRGAEWAVVSNFEQLEIVNVRWVQKNSDFLPFRTVTADEFPEEAPTLALLTPSRVQQRDLYLQAEAEAPRKSLERARPGERALRPPITEAVLRTLLARREELLASPPAGELDAAEYDEKIHRLLMRLIFIRACEDMGLEIAERLETVESAAEPYIALDTVLQEYQALYHSELFDPLDLRSFSAAALKRTIRSLYGEPGVVEYDFAAIEADILGMMYEEYLQWHAVAKIEVASDGEQVRLFKLERVTTENIKRKRGIYYTPSFLVEAMVERAFDQVGAEQARLDGGRAVTVADLACGSGAFLASALRRILSERNPTSYQEAAEILQTSIFGIDSDPRAVEATRLNLWLTLFRLYPEVHPLPALSSTVFAQDTLTSSILPVRDQGSAQPNLFSEHERLRPLDRSLPVRPTIVLGNPPFVPIERIPPEYQKELSEIGYQTTTQRYDLANVFVERALQVVQPDGIVGLVVPNRVFSTASASSLRRLLSREAKIEQVIDFHGEQIFPAKTYVSVVFLRRVEEPPKRQHVPVIRIERLDEPRALQLREALFAANVPAGVQRFGVTISLSEAPVLLIPGRASGLIRRLNKAGVSVSQAGAESKQGIRAGAKNLFLLQERGGMEVAEEFISVSSYGRIDGQVRTAVIERAALRPAIEAQQLRRYEPPASGLWLLYPYDASGHLIPFEEYTEQFPRAAGYLTQHRTMLSKRSRIAANRWHALSLPRESSWLSAPKLLVPELATEGRLTVDSKGYYLVQGFALILRESAQLDLVTLLGVLNSTLLVWLSVVNAPRLVDDTFRYQGKILEQLPIPSAIIENGEVRETVRRLATQLLAEYSLPVGERSYEAIVAIEAELDSCIYQAADLSAREVGLVEHEMRTFRPRIPIQGTEVLLDLLRSSQVH